MPTYYGSINQTSGSLPSSQYIGLQCTPISYVALVFAFRGYSLTNEATIDEIVLTGHNLYVDYLMSRNSQPRMVGHSELPRMLAFKDGQYVSGTIITDQYHGILNADISDTDYAEFQLVTWSRSLVDAFAQSSFLLVTLGFATVATWRLGDNVYIFDSHGHQDSPASLSEFFSVSEAQNYLNTVYAQRRVEFEISPVIFDVSTVSHINARQTFSDCASTSALPIRSSRKRKFQSGQTKKGVYDKLDDIITCVVSSTLSHSNASNQTSQSCKVPNQTGTHDRQYHGNINSSSPMKYTIHSKHDSVPHGINVPKISSATREQNSNGLTDTNIGQTDHSAHLLNSGKFAGISDQGCIDYNIIIDSVIVNVSDRSTQEMNLIPTTKHNSNRPIDIKVGRPVQSAQLLNSKNMLDTFDQSCIDYDRMIDSIINSVCDSATPGINMKPRDVSDGHKIDKISCIIKDVLNCVGISQDVYQSDELGSTLLLQKKQCGNFTEMKRSYTDNVRLSPSHMEHHKQETTKHNNLQHTIGDNCLAFVHDIVDLVHLNRVKTDLNAFKRIIEAIPRHSCIICCKMLFEDQVFHSSKDSIENEFTNESEFCHTCCRKLNANQIVNKCWRNNLHTPVVPKLLTCLNIVEKRFIAQLQTYMTLIILPGGQYAERGLAIHFPFNIVKHVTQLPCNIANANLICIAGNVKRFVRMSNILEALVWLQNNNHLYKDIIIHQEELQMDKNDMDSMGENLWQLEEVGSVATDQVIHFPFSYDKPVSYEDEPDSEALAFPWLHPHGTSHYIHQNNARLTLLAYYQSRLLSKDNLFRLDIPYLIVAVNHYERTLLRTIVGVYARIYRQYSENFDTSNDTPQLVTAKDIRSTDFRSELLYGFNSYMFAKQIRGTVAYWRNELWNLMARVKLLGPPTLFVTLSAADTQWPELQQLLLYDAAHKTGTVSLNDLVRKNPVLTAVYFERRYRAFFKHVLNGKSSPLGTITDHWSRIEFQNRGSPHIHMFLWIDNAPSFEKGNTATEVTEYVDKIISTDFPEDENLKKLVSAVQTHHHTHTCRKYSSSRCRFRYPRSETSKTRILPDKLTAHGRVFYETKRQSNAGYINAYNPFLLSVWKANMDIQLVNGITGLAAYVCNYICKEEPSDLREALEKVFEQSSDSTNEARRKMLQIGMCILKHREISAQEAAFRICHLPLVYSSRQVVTINTFMPKKRMKRLKPKKDLEGIPDDSPDIFYDSIIDKYRNRPIPYEEMSLHYIASNYKFEQCKNGTKLKHRTKPVAIRTPHFVPNTDEYFYSILLLYYPHRCEAELTEGYSTVREALEDKLTDLSVESMEKEQAVNELFKCTSRIQSIRKYEEELNKLRRLTGSQANDEFDNVNGQPSETVWNCNDGINAFTDTVAHPTKIASKSLFTIQGLLQESNAFNRLNSQNDSALANIASLTKDQLFILDYVQNKVINNEIFHIFVTGEAGTGKSYLLKIIIAWLRMTYTSGTVCNSVLVTAPTGIAALNIDGITIHSALGLPVQHGKEPSCITEFSQLTLKKMRSKLKNTKCLVIDEISMVSSKMLDFINSRLCTILGTDTPFGGIHIIFSGDFFQLKPVRGHFAFTNQLLWPLLQPLFLTENVRQCKDLRYAHLLSKARVGILSQSDIALLQSRVVSRQDQDEPRQLHLYPTCKQVQNFNQFQQNTIKHQCHTIHSIDVFSPSDFAEGCLVPDHLIPKDARTAGGFIRDLRLSVGTRIMLIRNLCCEDGLVNGILGNVESFEMSEGKIDSICVKFDDENVAQFFKDTISGTVCINRHSVGYYFKGRYMTRMQFPIAPSWACTIHKAQGISLPSAVISIGKEIFAPGQAYVALSRVQTLSGLILTDLCVQRCYADPQVISNELEMLQSYNALRSRHNV